VWHATLNAFGGAFLFTFVTGADNIRLGVLLAVAYAVLAIAGAVFLGRRVLPGGDLDPATESRSVVLAA
jgi:hypothetical protein